MPDYQLEPAEYWIVMIYVLPVCPPLTCVKQHISSDSCNSGVNLINKELCGLALDRIL